METIFDIQKKYRGKIDNLDLELIISRAIKKTREFVLTYPEHRIKKNQIMNIQSQILRRIKHEPIAYIFQEKEFYSRKFFVNKDVLIPRPETEMLIDLALKEIQNEKYKMKNIKIIDVGTGSGNIIITLAHNIKNGLSKKFEFYGIDKSKKALRVARRNAKLNRLNEKIKFFHGKILSPFIENWDLKIGNSKIIIVANLPYLSSKIYQTAPSSVKNYEPKSALLSQKDGLGHYEKLLKQIIGLNLQSAVICLWEISPEQKEKIKRIIKKYFPKTKIKFHRDLSKRWRICQLEILNDNS